VLSKGCGVPRVEVHYDSRRAAERLCERVGRGTGAGRPIRKARAAEAHPEGSHRQRKAPSQ
jgi:hypothetical protein